MTTKKDLIDRIAESTGTRQTLVKAVVQEFFAEITSELAQGNRLEFRDFGVFDTKTTPARTAQNPRTQEKVHVPARRRVVFKPGRLIRQRLNGQDPDRGSGDEKKACQHA
jgi:integration host factor subunit beta